MRSLIIGFVVFLAACNQGTNNVPYSDPALVAKVDSLTKALADATHVQAEQMHSLGKLTLIGKLHGVASESLRMQGEFRTEAVSPPSFGPCADMGVLVGFTNGTANAPADPLVATYQAFKQCTGYYYEVTAADGSLAPASRLYFDGLNCTGNKFAWNAGGVSFNDQVLSDGVVFKSPADGSQLMVVAGQIPVMTQVQSVWIISNGSCTPDGDFQPMYSVTPNQISISGVPESVGVFQLAAP